MNRIPQISLPSTLDFSNAILVSPNGIEGSEAKALTVLLEEIEKRAGIALPHVRQWPGGNHPIIAAGTEQQLKGMVPEPYMNALRQLDPPGQEGYRLLAVKGEQIVVLIVGADARGVLYGIGQWLRKSTLKRQSIAVDANLRLTGTPHQQIRGHQLGYRPKTNAYDAWSAAQFEQYIRELALFGANSIEIVPPRTDDDPTGPLMQVDPLEMMIRLSEIIDSYGLDTWIWYPNMGDNYTDPATIQAELAEREEIFAKVPHIRAVFIPGSDPGHLEPDVLFPWCANVAQLLKNYHPEAKIWMSPQVMATPDLNKWLESFLEHVRKQPEWLGGIVFAPHVDMPLPELRAAIPDRYPIRRCEDITHNFHCQYPVRDWDPAFALTLGRESINPRPLAEKHIHNLLAPYANGNISYSEGINDDVNKFIWSDQDWNSQTPAIETLRDYARFFIDCDLAEGIAQGLLALERNWEGPLGANEEVDTTLRQWQTMEHSAPPAVLNNYRFQLGLLRAYYDAYIKRRLIYETELELEATDALRAAPSLGALAAVEKAEAALRRAKTEPVAQQYRRRCDELADELFKNIGAQLSVIKHHAISLGRGAFMDAIDFPLNDSMWLSAQCAMVKQMDNETSRLDAIHKIVNRTNPGPGGFYDNLGSYKGWRRVDKAMGWENDPGYLHSPRMAHAVYLLQTEKQLEPSAFPPLASIRHANALADTVISVSYEHLDPSSSYTVKVTYVGDTASDVSRDCRVTLVANGEHVVQNHVLVKQGQCTQIESPIPKEALASGKLILTWCRDSGFKRLNVSEVWIIRRSD